MHVGWRNGIHYTCEGVNVVYKKRQERRNILLSKTSYCCSTFDRFRRQENINTVEDCTELQSDNVGSHQSVLHQAASDSRRRLRLQA